MKKLKIDKKTSKKIVVITAGLAIVAGSIITFNALKKKENTKNINNEQAVVDLYNTENELVSSTNSKISNLFPEMNKETIDDATLILLLDLLAKEDSNGKISADVISNFKTRIDSNEMMSDFNAFLDVLENEMITKGKFISISNVLPSAESKDIAILSNIESITSTIIYLAQNNGSKEQIVAEYNKIYSLFVDEKEVTVNGEKFKVRDLSYANRAVAEAYARTVAYYARAYVSEASLERLDARTNSQNNKAYIKTKLEILSNEINEESKENVVKIFNDKYISMSSLLKNKVSLSDSNIKNLINYSNLEYLTSDVVATKDKNTILNSYDEEKVSEAIDAIDTIYTYNMNNQKSMVSFSDLLLDSYKQTDKGQIDKIALDFVQYNSIMLLNTVSSTDNISSNPYFHNLYKYFTKQDFTHSYKTANGEVKEVKVVWQDISDSVNFVNAEVIINTLNKLEKLDYKDSYMEKAKTNLTESIQYIQNAVTDECEKVYIDDYVFTITK